MTVSPERQRHEDAATAFILIVYEVSSVLCCDDKATASALAKKWPCPCMRQSPSQVLP